jgi:hypothetical protein
MVIKNDKTRGLLAGFLREGAKNGAAMRAGGGSLACMLYGAYTGKAADNYLTNGNGARRIPHSPGSEEYAQAIAGLLEIAIEDQWTAWDWIASGPVELLEKPLIELQDMPMWKAFAILEPWGAYKWLWFRIVSFKKKYFSTTGRRKLRRSTKIGWDSLKNRWLSFAR